MQFRFFVTLDVRVRQLLAPTLPLPDIQHNGLSRSHGVRELN